MGVAKVSFDEDCEVVVGGQPTQPSQPVTNPRLVGRTNTPFIITDGLHCFSLRGATRPAVPLWQIGQVNSVNVLQLIFK
jgi:hypothetical protein